MTDFKQKLQDCRTCEEARPILETMKARPSARKLVETAIQLKQSKDPRQQSYGLDFMQTAIRELEDDENDKTKEANGSAHPMDVGAGAKDIDKKMSEADEITGSLDSHQSSDIDMPYKQEGTDEPQSDIESMQTASGENQMGGIKENMAPYPGQGQMAPPTYATRRRSNASNAPNAGYAPNRAGANETNGSATNSGSYPSSYATNAIHRRGQF